jgi:hypothetical protein
MVINCVMYDEHVNGVRTVRRMPHTRGLLSARTPRRGGGLQAASASSSGLSSAASREPIDPIAGVCIFILRI